MKKENITVLSMAIMFACVLALSGCNSSSDSDTSSSSSSSSTSAELNSYADDVAACSPPPIASSEGIPGAEENSGINVWAGWDPDAQYSVFWKLLSQSGNESLYGPISLIDDYIETINGLVAKWNTPLTAEPVDTGDDTAAMTVDTSVTSVTVPFFTNSQGQPIVQAVDRVITITGDSYVLKMAFTISGEEEALVARFERTEDNQTETSVFYATKADDGQIDIWSACHVDYSSQPDYYGAFRWRGNPDAAEPWFALSQYTNAANDSWVLAGGEPGGDMAFLAIRSDDIVMGTNAAYLICDIDSVTTGGDFTGTIYKENETAPSTLLAANPVLKYVIDGNADCLGYINTYPENSSDLDWVE